MKIILLIFVSIIISMHPVKSQNVKEELDYSYHQLNSSTAANKVVAAVAFDCIAVNNPESWLANYYAAYANANVSLFVHDDRRRIEYIKNAEKYLKNQSFYSGKKKIAQY